MAGLSMVFRPGVNRGTQDIIHYNPARDLAYLYAEFYRQVAMLLEEATTRWPEYREVFEGTLGVQVEDLAAPMKAVADFLILAESQIDAMPAQIMKSVGWDRLDPKAKMALQAATGQVAMGMIFHAIREVRSGCPWPRPASTSYLTTMAGCFADFVSLSPEERAKLTSEDKEVRVPAREEYVARLRERMGVPESIPFPLPYISTGEAATCGP